MTTWFTSDLHLNHDREFIYGVRSFRDVNDMNNRMVDRIIRTIQPGDNLYFLGDVAMSRDKLEYITGLFELITSMNVHVTWHMGNHDNPRHWDTIVERFGEAVTVYAMNYVARLYEDDRFVTSHFPFKGTPHKNGEIDEREAHLPFPTPDTDGRILIHGHTHSPGRTQSNIAWRRQSIHVGWDAWHRLVSLDEILGLCGFSA